MFFVGVYKCAKSKFTLKTLKNRKILLIKGGGLYQIGGGVKISVYLVRVLCTKIQGNSSVAPKLCSDYLHEATCNYHFPPPWS